MNYSLIFYSAVYINRIKKNCFIGVHILIYLLSYCMYIHNPVMCWICSSCWSNMNFGGEMSIKYSLMRPKRRWVTDMQNVLGMSCGSMNWIYSGLCPVLSSVRRGLNICYQRLSSHRVIDKKLSLLRVEYPIHFQTLSHGMCDCEIFSSSPIFMHSCLSQWP